MKGISHPGEIYPVVEKHDPARSVCHFDSSLVLCFQQGKPTGRPTELGWDKPQHKYLQHFIKELAIKSSFEVDVENKIENADEYLIISFTRYSSNHTQLCAPLWIARAEFHEQIAINLLTQKQFW